MHTFFSSVSHFMSNSVSTFVGVIFLIVGVSSCIPPDIKGTAETQFFDLKGFLDNQISKLKEEKVTVVKKTVLQGQKSEQTLNDINWKKEFAFFYSSDINTPQLRDRYKIEKTPQKWTFQTEEENLMVKKMQVLFYENNNDTSFENVKQLLIIQKDKNNLYENDRTLIIKVKNELLESYSIEGSEEVILNEKQEFLVEGIIK